MSWVLANVIFPAPSAVYLATAFFPVAAALALCAEWITFLIFQRGVMSRPGLLGFVFGVNLASWLIGIVLSFGLSAIFPSGLESREVHPGQRILQPGATWTLIAVISYPVACILSIVIEYTLARMILPKLNRPLLCVVVANMASYLVLGAMVLLWPK